MKLSNKVIQNKISVVHSGGIGEELGIQAGDRLISINGIAVKDVIDYLFLIADEFIMVEIQKPDGEIWELEIDKEFDEKLGIEFENPILDDAQQCKNKCIFCFIDQMPPGMRPTLYFKDDDARLSFLQGNFITLTNVSEEDIDRMIRYQISPVNVSIHTTNPELRVRMLGNRFAGEVLKRMEKLVKGGVELNGQIVLCPGWNDGAELDRTIKELLRLHPGMTSLAVVPIGLTKFREGLENVQHVDYDKAQEILRQINDWQDYCLKEIGTRFVYAADEIYLKAEVPIPPQQEYEGFPQIENGVGLLRKFEVEFTKALKACKYKPKSATVTIATGTAAAPFIRDLCQAVVKKYPQLMVDVVPVENIYFGTTITVAGLLTGQDVLKTLQKQKMGDRVLFSQSMLKAEDTLFLDDMTVEKLESTLGVPCIPVESEGKTFLYALLGRGGAK